MFDMVKDSIVLFLQGRLFKDTPKVIGKALIGMTVAAAILVIMVKLGAPLWASVIVSSLAAGALQPYLFKDLKYA